MRFTAYILALVLMAHSMAFGQSSTPADTLKIGIPANSADKGLIFDTGDGSSNKKLLVEKISKLLKFDGNSFQLGDGALTEDKKIIFNGTSGAYLKYDYSNTELSTNDDLAIDSGKKLKTNSIDAKSGTVTSVEQDLRAKGKIFLGSSGSVQLRENSGKLEFSNDGTVYKKVGSGAGGSGAQTLLENGGFEDGVTSQWSSSPSATAVTGSSALDGETSASFNPSALNDYLRTDYKTIKPGLYGNSCEARFKYTGGDALNWSAKVETESGVTLGYYRNGSAGANVLPLHSNPGYESVFFNCPTAADIASLSTNGNVRLVIYQGTASDAAAIVVDDVHFGGLIGLVETTLPEMMSAQVITTSGTVSNESADFINGNCTAANPTVCTFQSNVFTVAPNCTVSVGSHSSVVMAISSVTSSSISIKSILSTDGNAIATMSFTLSCQKQGADAKQSVQVYKSIPKIASTINRFTAKSTSASPAVISNENADWISGDGSRTGTGNFTYTFAAGTFSAAPNCGCTPEISGGGQDYTCFISSVSSSAISIITTTNGTVVNPGNGIHLWCDKGATDFTMPTVQPVVLGQVTNSTSEGSALTNVRTETCSINNSGSSSVDTASGMCGWVVSTNRSSAGVVTVTYTGTFSAEPVCDITPFFAANNRLIRITSKSSSSITITSVDGALAAADTAFNISCTGKR